MTVASKVQYVRVQKQTRMHECHGGCGRQCKPAMWGCLQCWRRLPQSLRNKIWHAYRPGQEIDGKPSAEYLEVAREVQDYVRARNVNEKVQSKDLVSRLREELEKRAFTPGELEGFKHIEYCDFCSYSREYIARAGHGDGCLLKGTSKHKKAWDQHSANGPTGERT